MARHLARLAALALVPCLALAALGPRPALGQQPARPKSSESKSGESRSGEKAGGAAPVIACPSVVNYRMLMHDGAAAAAATLADPKADHLGCAALPRARIGSVVDRVTLGGRAYDCAAVQGTTACHWLEAGALPAAGEDGWR